MHREQFIHRAILDAQECRKGFYHKDSIKTDVSFIHQLCPVFDVYDNKIFNLVVFF